VMGSVVGVLSVVVMTSIVRRDARPSR